MNRLLELGKKVFRADKMVEYKCPHCGGVASIFLRFGMVRAECHACGRWEEEYYER